MGKKKNLSGTVLSPGERLMNLFLNPPRIFKISRGGGRGDG